MSGRTLTPPMGPLPLPGRALVVGLGVTGAAVAGALSRRGSEVVVVDDQPGDASRARANELGVELFPAPAADGWAALVAGCDAVLPAPGVPDAHPVFAAAADAGVPVLDEFDLAATLDDRPVVAITGTNGKTTVTTLVAEVLRAAGRNAVEAGNTEVPLVAAIDDPSVDVFVVEASSFRLGHARWFAPRVGTWLNFAPDHLDVHASLERYELSKARLWADQGADDTAVGNSDDPVVARHLPTRPGGPAVVTFGLDGRSAAGHWTVVDGVLCAPDGERVLPVDNLWRSFPHDVANALGTCATTSAAGVGHATAADVLADFQGLGHRVERLGELDGTTWYDDSKATTPHATVSAVGAFDSVVLIAGGRNKGVDLSTLRTVADRLRAVVAFGDAAEEVAAAFAGSVATVTASSMDEAVDLAAGHARPGDAVLLSPGCASFDWYRSYAERGDDFARAFDELRRRKAHSVTPAAKAPAPVTPVANTPAEPTGASGVDEERRHG
jgi:UDP-N-acetylmuramoylalanine--D-glutamate ligase